jgi:hypothetical protein
MSRLRPAPQSGPIRVHTGFLDTDDKHPALYGECILLRDDDGMGFALGLSDLIGKEVEITIRVLPVQRKRLW